MWPQGDSNPYGQFRPLDFKSNLSTNSNMRPLFIFLIRCSIGNLYPLDLDSHRHMQDNHKTTYYN